MPHSSRLRRLSAVITVLVAATALGSVPSPAQAAQTRTWTGAVSSLWSDGRNWAGGTAPAPGDALDFSSHLRLDLINDYPARTTFGPIDIDAPQAVLSGNPLATSSIRSVANLSVIASLEATGLTLQAVVGRSIDVGGVIGGEGGLTTEGLGTVRLAANNLYPGATIVDGGSTVIDGSVRGAVVVRTFGTLAGRGAVGGAVSVGNGATLAPGPLTPGSGTFTVLGDVALDRGATYRVGIDSTGTSDLLALSGGRFTPGGATLDVDLGHTPAVGTTFVIASGSAPITGRFDGLPEGATFVAGSSVLTISYARGDVTLTVVRPPTATIVVDDTDLRAGETSRVTVTFDQPVTGFTVDDLTVPNGTLRHLVSTDGGITWTATLTPDADVRADSNVVTLTNAGVANLAGTPGVGTTTSNTYAVRTRPLGARIDLSDTALRIGDSATVTVTFDDAVVGFTAADLTAPNGTVSDLRTDDNITFTATLSPADGVEDATNVLTLDLAGVTTGSGERGVGTVESDAYAVDTVRPWLLLEPAFSERLLGIGQTSEVTITFSEPVTGVDVSAFTVQNGSITDLRSTDGGTTWSAVLRPAADTTSRANSFAFRSGGLADLAGNTSLPRSFFTEFDVDTVRPTATVVVRDPALRAGDTTLLTLTFSEAVTGLAAADLTVPNGSIGTPTSSDGGVTWTATLTPDAGVRDATNQVLLDLTGVQDAAANTGTGTTGSNPYAVDTVRPTATVDVSDALLAISDVAVLRIEFSEAVQDLDADDLAVENGTLSGLGSTDGGITWIASLTPAPSVEDPTNVVTLDLTGVRTLTGNAGTGTATSGSYAVDTVRPTATIDVADTDLRTGDTSPVTITFSEAVQGFDDGDLDVPNGDLSTVATADGGRTWTATLTPDAGVRRPANVITLDLAGVGDLAGNAGAGTATSGTYAVDTVVAPTDRTAPTSAADGPELSAPRRWTVTYAATDAGSGVAQVDLYVRAPGETAYRKVDTAVTAEGELSFTGREDGTYDFHTVATDRAGNVEDAPTTPDVSTVLDTTAPESAASGPRLTGDRTWTVGFRASDAGSGVASVDLYVRAPGDSAYTKVDTATGPEGELTYTATTDGTHRFHTVATDRAGHVETAPRTPDVTARVDTRAPALEALGTTPWVVDVREAGPLRMRFRVDEDVDVSVRVLRRGTPVRAFATRPATAGVLVRRWAGRDDGGARVQPGRYRVVVAAEDAAGHRTRVSVPVRVRR